MGYRYHRALWGGPPLTTTENAAVTYQDSGSPLVDLFSLGGALRSRTPADRIALFKRAYEQNPLLATKLLFYLRDIRGGQGERDTFRILFSPHSGLGPYVIAKNLHHIPHFGRWDDLVEVYFACLETNNPAYDRARLSALDLIGNQLEMDLERARAGYQISLLAKWLPSENTSSPITRLQARALRRALKISSRRYRKLLSELRAKLGVCEPIMSANRWDDIVFEHVPSRALMIYRNAFLRHQPQRFLRYLADVKEGKKTIHAGTLYPYDIVESAFRLGTEATDTLEQQWANLPDYFDGKYENSLVVCDTSGSMFTNRVIAKAVSLALYTAERNTGPFHNRFITFSQTPELVAVEGESLGEKAMGVAHTSWGMNTNLQRVFDLLLDVAQDREGLENFPKRIYIVSDMEFDSAVNGGQSFNAESTNLNVARRKFAEAGIEMPEIVFWNVDARHNQSPVQKDERGIMMVSGCSPSIFTHMLKGEALTAEELMMNVLNSQRYEGIVV